MRLRLRALVVGAGFVAAFAGVVAACSDFDEEPTVPTSEGGSADVTSEDSGPGDAPVDAPPAVDAGLGDDATTVLATGLAGLVGVAVTDADEVVVALASGQTRRMPLVGGNDGGTTLGLQNVTGLSAIAITGGQMMFATSGGDVGKSSIDGSNAASKGAGATLTSLVTADTSSVFTVKTGTGVEIRRYRLDLNTGEGYGSQPPAGDLAIAGLSLYWTDPAGGRIVTGTTSASPAAATFQSGEVGCSGVAADLFGVYWLTPNAVRARALVDGGAPKTIANDNAVAIAAKDGTVYWLSSAAPGRLRKAELADDQGPRQTLASGFALDFKPSQKPIALTETYVVWITSDGRVLRHDR